MVLNSTYATYGVAPAIGIDLGTSSCGLAVFIQGQVRHIPNFFQGNSERTPSYVSFKSDGSRTFGYSAKETAYEDPENTIYDVMRIIGKKITDEKLQEDMKLWPFQVVKRDGVPKILVNGKLYFPEQVVAELLGHFRAMAENFLRVEVTKAVITVPACFNEDQRLAIIDAGELAGLEVLTILDKPTAAAIAYSTERLDYFPFPKTVLVFDLDATTFNVAVVKMSPVEVLGFDGNTHLGGDDFDKNMMEYCALKFKAEEGVDLLADQDSQCQVVRCDARRRLRRLQDKCEKAKIALSDSRTATVTVEALYDGVDLKLTITRDEFEKINTPIFQKMLATVENAIKNANVRKEEIGDVVLVGGSTRIPKVQEMLKHYFGGRQLNYTVQPEKIVAHGAAVKAAMISGEEAKDAIYFNSMEDVISEPIGIEVYTKELSVIVPKNTKMLKRYTKQFVTAEDNQTSCCIKVYQGEDSWAANNDLLGELILNGIPPAPARAEIIDVSMEMDSRGILNVEAVCRSKKNISLIPKKQQRIRFTRWLQGGNY